MYEEELHRRGFVFLSGQTGVMAELHRRRDVEADLLVDGKIDPCSEAAGVYLRGAVNG